jgi:predicted PurR-regulated permease PerM
MHWPETIAPAFDWVHAHLPFSRSLTAEALAAWLHDTAGHTPVLAIGATAMDVVTTLLLAVYMLVDGPRAFDWMMSLVPARERDRLAKALRVGARRMQGWVDGQGILMLAHGGSALVTFWLIGLPYFFALALFAAVINIIPVLGPFLTLVAAGLVAATNSPGKLLGVVIFYLAYHNAENVYLQPRVMSSAVGIPGVAVVAALVIGGEVAGIIGMALSVPTAVLIAEIKRQYLGTGVA